MIWLRSLTGQIAIIASLAIAAASWLALHDRKVIEKHTSRVEAQERKIDAKAQSAKRRATSDVDRVLPRYFRD